VEIPKAPRGLSAGSKRIWDDINSTWVLDAAALPMLAAGLECLDRYRSAAAEMKKDGATIETSAGLRTHPAHTVARDNLREARQIFRQLNLEVGDPYVA
jgi:phage terminase small subunit